MGHGRYLSIGRKPVSESVAAAPLADAPHAGRSPRADVAAVAAVAGVPIEVGVWPTSYISRNACSLVAVWCRFAAHVATGTAVVRIRIQGRASSAAVDSTFSAPIKALPVDARAILVGARIAAGSAAGATVVEVVGHIRAMTVATGRPRVTADKGPATSADAVGVAAAGLARREAAGAMFLGILIAERLTWVQAASPGGSQAERTKKSAGDGSSQQAQ